MKKIAALLLIFIAGISRAQTDENKKINIEDRITTLLNAMTLEEKIEMLSGTGFATTPNVRLGIPEFKMTDGPVGVRWEKSVAFPSSIMLAATFDTSLAFRYGAALGKETKARERNTILGPCVNINRTPQGGRNFESFGEDPFLTSRLAVSYIQGVQSEGVVAVTKHFAVNNQETNRMSINATVDKRALYEIYFPAFKAAVQEGKTEAIMCAYNKLNGSYCSENKFLLTDVLKTEWKFDGFVMSDWGAVHSTENAAAEGLDLEMPGGEFFTAEKLLPLVKNGKIQETVIDDKIRRMLRVMFRMKFFESHFNKPEPNAPAQRLTALDVARSGIVLLKNEKNILPINPAHYKSVAVIGPNADVLRTGGGGSSQVVPMQSESPLDGVRRIFGKNTKIHFALGARLGGDVPSIEQRCFFLPNDSAGKNGIEAEYFNNIALTGKPTVVRIDSAINFYWNDESPAEGIEKDNFSVRWKTKLKPETTGLYELTTATDDGVRLFINGKILIDDWSDHAVEARSVKIFLEEGKMYDLKMEYYERGGAATALLGWIKPNESELETAVAAAQKSELVLLFGGYSQFQESEGFDRHSIDLPENQIELINEIAKVNPNIIWIMNAGAPVTLQPWLEKIKALVWAFYPGQEGTEAILEVLTGKTNPSGKLPFTIGKRWEDYPSYNNFPGNNNEVEYKEGILVGYRYFDTKKIEPEFPFGFGLSYTTFSFSDLNIQKKGNDTLEVTVKIKNTGTAAGAEVIQLYLNDKKPKVLRPEKELKAFTKVQLNAGEEKIISLKLNNASFQYYHSGKNRWEKSARGYELLIGTSSRTILLRKSLSVNFIDSL